MRDGNTSKYSESRIIHLYLGIFFRKLDRFHQTSLLFIYFFQVLKWARYISSINDHWIFFHRFTSFVDSTKNPVHHLLSSTFWFEGPFFFSSKMSKSIISCYETKQKFEEIFFGTFKIDYVAIAQILQNDLLRVIVRDVGLGKYIIIY